MSHQDLFPIVRHPESDVDPLTVEHASSGPLGPAPLTTIITSPLDLDATLPKVRRMTHPQYLPVEMPEPVSLPSSVQLADITLPKQNSAHTRRQSRRTLGRGLALVLYDALMLNAAFYLAYAVRFIFLQGVTFAGATFFVEADLGALVAFQVALVLGMLLMLGARGMYRLRVTGAFWQQGSLLFVASTACFAFFSVYEFFFRATQYELVKDTRAIVVFTWIAAMIVPFVGRLLLALGVTTVYRLGFARTRLLVVGAGRTGKVVMQHFAALPALAFQVMGFLDDGQAGATDFGRFKLLGTLDACERVLRTLRIGEVIIALSSESRQQINQVIQVCEALSVPFRLVPDIHNLSLARVDLETVEDIPMLSIRRAAMEGWQRGIKRLVDIVGASLILLLGAPIWLLIALLIRLDSAGPIIFKQQRVGLRGMLFTSYKFRSMFVGAEAQRAALRPSNHSGRGLFKLKDDPRCTRVGKRLRRMSMDEIPQLWNVLRGEMSLVGPRPPLPDEVARYEDWELRRLEMPPGLTGLWQVRGRSDIGFEEMVLMDLYYLENWSLRLDFEILLKTIPAVIFRRGAY